MPKLATLEMDVLWAPALIAQATALNTRAPVVKTLIIQATASFVFAGLQGLRWDVFGHGLASIAGHLEEIRCVIRGGSKEITGSFQEVLRERVVESNGTVDGFSITEGYCDAWPKPGGCRRAIKAIPQNALHEGWGNRSGVWNDTNSTPSTP
ncbi:hypothetical protein V5O48_012503 [Marasmius crinis-equi]|uniref:Uncharacterized protein n=1 Tax=Marasmius crinis-equi TaxID=585013 RepID=A0ABR3F2L5_9AGAR